MCKFDIVVTDIDPSCVKKRMLLYTGPYFRGYSDRYLYVQLTSRIYELFWDICNNDSNRMFVLSDIIRDGILEVGTLSSPASVKSYSSIRSVLLEYIQ